MGMVAAGRTAVCSRSAAPRTLQHRGLDSAFGAVGWGPTGTSVISEPELTQGKGLGFRAGSVRGMWGVGSGQGIVALVRASDLTKEGKAKSVPN